MKNILRLSRAGARSLSGSPSHSPFLRYAVNAAWQRGYSAWQSPSRSDGLPGIDASKLSVTKTTSPKNLLPPKELVFGSTFTDHMLRVNWNTKDGWLAPEIVPYQNLSLDPATCVFHYAFECFEGMKAYKGKDGSIRLFRPDKNMARLNKSSKRIALPTFDGETMIKLIGDLVKLDSRFIHSEPSSSIG
ncbi:branched-chain-amino-acid aminotransferase [Coccidioides immitis RMSCC 3703]|uniref:Branched-chain-amino-acid aminotransferase n=1 Tax=Coccidioides immitis RMSCC 3703 TaxID=454286 RepID=A0A0J8QM41_COCIT|nr:branched-chain-amino-acid aminotransferase [Coccidioides immitis RMSCC 3703]